LIRTHLHPSSELSLVSLSPSVLTLFAFTTSAKYAYRAVASFVKHVTGAETRETDPFPPSAEEGVGYSHQNSSGSTLSSAALASSNSRLSTSPYNSNQNSSNVNVNPENGLLIASKSNASSGSSPTSGLPKLQTQVSNQFTDNIVDSPQKARAGSGFVESPISPEQSVSGFSSLDKVASRARKQSLKAEKKRKATTGIANDYTGQVPLMRPAFTHHMIR